MIMPSETMDLPSFFFTDATFPSERQIGFWKSDSLPDHFATAKSISMAPFESLGAVEHQSARSFELHQSLLTRDQKLIHSLGRHAVGAERVVSQSPTLSRSMVPDPGTRSSLNSQFASKCENSLFSRSLSELFDRKSSFSSNNVSFSQPVDAGASHDEEPFESLEEIEAQTIGNLLPSDEDLFSGMTDKLDNTVKSNGRDDAEELEFFSSVGGLDLEDDVSTAQNDIGFPGIGFNRQLGFGNGAIAGGHSYGEQLSRTLFVRNINSNVEDSELKALFEPYGEIHILYTSCKHRGFVMVSYYDIRAAINAKKELQDISMKRRKLDIHYSIPKDNPSEKDINQGTLVAFDIDASISNDELHQLFGAYGEIKEIHESPNTSHQKFIEFYDVRASQKALRASNRGDFEGKRIKLEPFHPGSSKRLLQQISPELEQDGSGPYTKRSSPPINSTMGFPGSVPRGSTFTIGMDSGTVFGLPSPTQAQFLESPLHHGIAPRIPTTTSPLLRTESADIAEFVHRQGHILGSPNFHPHSLPEYCDGLKSAVYCCSLGSIAANRSASPHERIDSRLLQGLSPDRNLEFSDGGFSSTVNGGSSLPGHHYSWSNSYHSHSPGGMWPNSPSCVNGIAMAHSPARLHGPPRPPPPVLSCVLPITNHHVGSAPTANSSLWDRRRAYAGESSETSFQPGSLGSLRISSNSMHSMELLSPNLFSPGSGNYTDLSLPPKHNQRSPIFPGRGQMSPRSNSFDSPNERARSRRNEGSINLADRKQYELDLERIRQGEDNRTTLMIKNIPNKYTSKMLLAAIDEHHKGTYDFIYLPIDFKNKCNVGYAFINMTEPSQIIPFYQAFNGKKWEKFNSEKVASLAYARIQGKAALIAHFQNSSLMNEDKRCRPILFNTDGPNAGEQVSFPMGVNVRTRPGKAKSITLEDLHCGGLPSPVNEDSSPGDSSSGTEKDSD